MTKYPEIEVKLIGEDGNAFFILGKVTQSLKRGLKQIYNLSYDEINQIVKSYNDEATSGDYDNLLSVTMKYVEVI